MKKYIRYIPLAAVVLLPLIVIYHVGQAQRPGVDTPASDGTEKTTPISQTLDGGVEIPLKAKANDNGVIPVLVELNDRPLADVYAEVLATPHSSKAQGQEMAR